MFEYFTIPYGICFHNYYIKHTLSALFITTFTGIIVYFVDSVHSSQNTIQFIYTLIFILQNIIIILSHIYVKFKSKLIIEVNQELDEYYSTPSSSA